MSSLVAEFSPTKTLTDALLKKDFSSIVNRNKWISVGHSTARDLGLFLDYEYVGETGLLITGPEDPLELERLLTAMQPELDRWFRDCSRAAVQDVEQARMLEARSTASVVGKEKRQTLKDGYAENFLSEHGEKSLISDRNNVYSLER